MLKTTLIPDGDDADDNDDDDDETNGETWGHGIGRPSTPVMLVTPHLPQHGDDDDGDDDDDDDDHHHLGQS